MPPFAALIDAIKAAKYAENGDKLGALGRVFQGLADKTGYFKAPGRLPEFDFGKLGKKYGVELEPLGTPEVYFGAQASIGNTSAKMLDNGVTVRDMLQNAVQANDARTYKTLASAVKNKQLTLDTNMQGIDMMMASQGTGAAKQLYMPLLERSLAEPDTATYASTGLSHNNMLRKGQTMSEAIEKFGDRAGDRIRIDNTQLAGMNGSNREWEYHALPTDQKIGLLNTYQAGRTANEVNKALEYARGGYGDVGNTGPIKDRMRALGLADTPWEPSTDVDPEYFGALSGIMRDIGNLPSAGGQKVGIDSLRRAAITRDSLMQGVMARDIESQPYLYQGLARKQGGSIPAHTPGALTRTCGCGG